MTSIYQGRVRTPGRFLGIETRSIVPAAVVALLFAFAVWFVPAWDNAVKISDPIEAGDVVQVAVIQFQAATGWNLEEGYRQGDPDKDGSYTQGAILTDDGVEFRVFVDNFAGTPRDLIAQIEKTNSRFRTQGALKITGDVQTIHSSQGAPGAQVAFDTNHVKGLLAAYVFGNVGVEISVIGPDQVTDSTATQVARMITSIRPARVTP